ncbi:site-specific DNA-methyltransferase [Clostridium estertheticum]|uniref:site-specific DNA-methyltransferase n=1 Tax=Clostridium estertheticum TaxID=238834 RepID=UPI001C0B1EBB|nr:site-specific DNA-methyltransferase [Clostridium estertheticum]MBU3176494.1 site-specific DNA-methyltransferase [Clostridium estertheticum]
MEKLGDRSMNIVAENIIKMKELFPEVFCEDKIDFKKLQETLGEYAEDEAERYSFNWKGKLKAIRIAQTPSSGTLRPAKEESKSFDTTKNLYIEGDNLEVLKLLQKTYNSKVKMIYIDPPYNTGNDFVYSDDFKDNIKNYLQITGQVDAEGRKLGTNSEASGRYHTDWLNMMYPRLKLARNLLSDNGVIFISIDDHEVDNLKKICNEIFGEENLLGIITWSKKRKGSFLSKKIISLTEYLLVYAKNVASGISLFGGKADNTESQPIIKRTNNISQLNIKVGLVKTKLNNGVYKKGLYGDIINPIELLDDVVLRNGVNENSFRIKAPFVWSQQFLDKEIEKGTKLIINTINFQIRAYRVYDEENFKGFPSYIDGVKIKGTNEDAYEELERIFKIKKLFDYSKPVNYIKELIKTSTYFDKNATILDFFSGASTTSHAVMQLNSSDNGNRKFIMVQLPEICDEKSEAYKAGYKNICEIGKERIRRAGEIIFKENKDNQKINNLDIGFKVFKLDTSNIKRWNADGENLEISIDDMMDNFVPNRTEEDIVYEIMLKYGIDLTYRVEIRKIAHKKIFSIGFGALFICIDDEITLEVVEGIVKFKNELNAEVTRVVFKDNGFKNDSVKTNAIHILRRNKIQEIMSI